MCNKQIEILIKDIVYLMKRCLQNSFYCESLDLTQSVPIKINRADFINEVSREELREALSYLMTTFSEMVQSKNKCEDIHILNFIVKPQFTDSEIRFFTFQFYINKLIDVDYNFDEFKKLIKI